MSEQTNNVKYPFLLLLTEIFLAIMVITIGINIFYKLTHRLFDWEMSWFFVKDIPYIGIIMPVCLVAGIVVQTYLSSLKE